MKRLAMKERKSITKILAERYRKATKKEKGKMLDEFISLTRYNRSYARYLLRNHGKKLRVGKRIVLVGDIIKKIKRNKQKFYDEDVFKALKRIWIIMGCICGKRLYAVLSEIISILENFKEIELESLVKEKLLKTSASTIDRLLKPERDRFKIKGRSNTKPGTLLKNQIPIRTFADWNENRPGFVEIDLVGHDGGNVRGDYAQTLNVTDVCTGWTETMAVKNKAQIWVFEALKEIKERLPFPLLGVDSDNGGEFINHHLQRYCEENKITFTKSRSYRKNNNCYVEQKNYSIVKRLVGYMRHDREEELKMLNELYLASRLYINYFQPVMKLTKKIRRGSKVKKFYDEPKTPYFRVIESPYVEEERKNEIKEIYATLNPAELKRRMEKIQIKLRRFVIGKNELFEATYNKICVNVD